MRKIILSLVSLLPLAALAQNNYTLTGNMPGLKTPARIYFARIVNNNWKYVDSVETTNGRFQFTGSLREPEQALIHIKRLAIPENPRKSDEIIFFLENSKITIESADSIKNGKIIGSVSESENEKLNVAMKPFLRKEGYLNTRFGNHNPNAVNETPEEKKIARDSMQFYIATVKAMQKKFVEEHFNSFIGLWAFQRYMIPYRFDPVVMEPMFRKFSSELQYTDLGKIIGERIAVEKRSQAGSKVIDFTLPDANGKPFTLSSLRGKYVFVDFWASWCVPCRAEMPDVRKAYAALKSKNLEIVGISVDDYKYKQAWLNAIKTDKMTWIQLSDLKGFKNEAAVLYGVNAVPQNFLVDPQGNIIAKDLHGGDLTAKLSALIK